MLQRDVAAAVQVHQCKSRRAGGVGHPGTFGGAAHQQRLARAQLAEERNEVAHPEQRSEPPAQRPRLLRRAQDHRRQRRNKRESPSRERSLATSAA